MKKMIIKRIFSALLCVVLLCLISGCTGNTNSNNETTQTNPSKTDSVDKIKDTDEDKDEDKDSDSKDEKIDPSEKLIALTFDDGPYSPVTESILDTLEKYNAKATFFVVGNRIDSYPKSVKRASDMGCEIGSHTYSHKNLTKLTPDAMNSEISKSNAAIKKITGKDISIVRPPEGAVNDSVKNTVKYPLVMWSVDSEDWKYKNSDKDYTEVMNDVFDGCIILMHDLYPETAKAVERLIPALMVEGYKFVTFSELMEARGVKLENGNKYFKAKPPEVTSGTTVSAVVNKSE